ncbi:hypothetical protein FS837_011715 [Tulasnella sp. UAMH 9824]|nr:hypothetical protein FS837_011715 [Tulasnella sp. UAMH 9824]
MQENKDYAADSSQASELGQEYSSGVSLHNSKLRNKLEKLAQWRIDPLFIEFSRDVREFRGGYATVSQAFLVPLSGRAVANESEHPMNEDPDSNVRSVQSPSVTKEAKDGQQGRDEGVTSWTADGGRDHTKGDGREDTVQDSGVSSPQSQSNTGGPRDDRQGKGDETGSGKGDETGSGMVNYDDGQAKEEKGEEKGEESTTHSNPKDRGRVNSLQSYRARG